MNKKPLKIKDKKDLKSIREELSRKKVLSSRGNRYRITVHLGTCGIASGAETIQNSVKKEISSRKRSDIEFTTSGCVGFCALEPMLTVESYDLPPVTYHSLDRDKLKKIFKSHIYNGKIPEELKPITEDSGLADFYKYQESRVLRNRGKIDPFKIEDYIVKDGYSGLAHAIETGSPEKIIKTVKESGLRGRGGAGFPTGRKWEFCRNAGTGSGAKYVICNGDEGDPGAFMERNLLESDPHSVLEGMLIAALAVGSNKGYLYIRAEYPLAVKMIRYAIDQSMEIGLLGKGILGTDFDLDIEVFQGSGAFVCGEETALMESIQGRRGMPQARPPYPSQRGLWEKPTLINNVKSMASIPPIVENGAQWFRGIGTDKSPGTAIFSVVGNILHAGLVEIPMGVTLRTLIFDICGGIPNQKRFKAVQIGGPSGGCIPETLLDLPVDYESLAKAGSIMGSGGMVVMDENTCMADVVRYFLNFTKSESCGQCTPCREGLERLYDIMDRICKGQGLKDDLERLEALALAIRETSLCGLGQSAPNPVLTALQYFKEEIEAHIVEKKCPAGIAA